MRTEKDFPFVSALLVTRNEQTYIEKAILSLVKQTYPKDKYELIIVDGESTDDTLAIIKKLINEYKTETFDIRIINNPNRILSSGWNLGVKNSRGEYVVRIDAHAEVMPDFIQKSVETILKVKDAVCVGGMLTTKSFDGDDDIVSMVLSSPFGVGNSSFRVSNTAKYTDTAVYGLYKKSIFDKVGYFNEKYVRNQDIEFHSRVRAVGGKFYFNPEINSVYYSRNTVKKMINQAFNNGKWNMVLLKNQKAALRLRHLIPFAFVLFIVSMALLGFINKYFWILGFGVLILHMLLGLFFATKKTNKLSKVLRIQICFLLLHFSYGSGYLAGFFTRV